jgi:AP-2 complex subunit mu-1
MKFHQCVKLPKFDKERSITFIPPDGSFELMSYRITQNVNLPFKIMPVYTEVGKNKLEIRVKMKGIFDKNLNATNVVVKIPSPKQTASVSMNPLVGRAKYEPEHGAIMWRIKTFQGELECFLQCEVLLSSSLQERPWTKPPISLEFNIPMFTASGLRIRFLKVYEKSGYKPSKLHKTLTKGGDYQHRL